MKINIEGMSFEIPELNKLRIISYGIAEIIDNFKDWRELITLSPDNELIIPYRFQLRNIRNVFWENISFNNTDKYFIELHNIIHIKKIRRLETGFQITIFDKISRNCFKRHPDIKYNFWILIKEGWHIFIFHFSRWYLLMEMGNGKDGYPEYEWKMPLRRKLFFTMLSINLPPESLVIPYDGKTRKKKVSFSFRKRNT